MKNFSLFALHYKMNLIAVLVVLFCSFWTSNADTIKVQTSVGTSAELRHVVSVDGKSYFVVIGEHGTWYEGQSFCNSVGMKLASFKSAVQYNTYKNSSYLFANQYWTSGRDALALRQFSWHDTETELSSEYLEYARGASYSWETCVLYRGGDQYLASAPCYYEAGFLCET